MPTIVPSYVYSLFASLLVGVIVVASCGIATSSIKTDAQMQQLENIRHYVAAEILNLLSNTNENQNISQYLDIPSHIGRLPYWIRIANDSESTWLEIGLGPYVQSNVMKEKLPIIVTASGSFVSSFGVAVLQCRVTNNLSMLFLGSFAPIQQSSQHQTYLNEIAYHPISNLEPAPVLSSTNITPETSLARANALWCTPQDSIVDVAKRITEGQIDVAIVQVGNYATDSHGTVTGIDHWYSRTQIIDWKNSLKVLVPSVNVYPWVLVISHFGVPVTAPDVDSTTNRAAIINLAVDYTVNNGFDGYNDDIETYSGSTENLASLWNGMGEALHNQGKEMSCASLIWTGYDYTNLYPNLDPSKIDYVYPMLYSDSPFPAQYIRSYMDYILTNYSGKVAVALMPQPQGEPTIDFETQLAAIDQQIADHGPYSNFVGVAIWEYDITLPSDWIIWNNWETKDD